MRLSKRIRALADSVTKGHTAADIGTDHGYVPMLLIRDGISPRVIMSDISEGSLAKARETFRQCGLMDKVRDEDFRTGDGLETIGAGEVDGKFACEIITAVPSGITSKELPYPEEDIRWKYPPSITEADPVLASNRIRWKTGSIREQIANMEKSGSSSETIAALKKDLGYLMALLSQTESRQKNLEN